MSSDSLTALKNMDEENRRSFLSGGSHLVFFFFFLEFKDVSIVHNRRKEFP